MPSKYFNENNRAVKLMGGLGSEKVRWTESCANLTSSYENLVGDALVSAGSIGESEKYAKLT